MSENRNHNTVRLAKMGMLVAVSIVLVYFVHFPIFPAVAFLEYDPADIPILMGTFAFGPVAGILLTVVTAVIQGVTVSAASGRIRDHHAHHFHQRAGDRGRCDLSET